MYSHFLCVPLGVTVSRMLRVISLYLTFACLQFSEHGGSHTARCPRCLVGPTIAPFLALLHELPLAGVGLAGVKKLSSV